jgi:hypothetical protein
MTATINEIADVITERVHAAHPKLHAKSDEGGPLLSPAFLIATPAFDYHTTARKKDFELEAWLLLANQLSRQVVRDLRTYAETTGIKAAVEGPDRESRTLGGLVDDCVVKSFRWISGDEYQMVEMVGGIFTIQIMGSTTS